MIDLRSDTVTKPTPGMRRAMAEAEVGDDVYGEDPTVNRLQERAAEIFDKEAAIFVPTGSMGNQTAVMLHTRRGQEVVIEERGHIYNFEMATMSAFAGVLARPVKSCDGSGILTWDEIASAIHTNAAYYVAPTGLIALENSHNLAGGSVLTRDRTEDICARAHEKNLPVHLDGARIFNAATALGETVANLARPADSVMFCLSKGLGAPVGSMLLGTQAFIDEARVVRKMLGGGMRQAGVLAAAGLIALEESPKGLPEDHANAKLMAEGVAELPGIKIDPESVVTNIVMFDVSETGLSPDEICAQLRTRGILAAGFGSSIRMVTHYDVSRADIESLQHGKIERLRRCADGTSALPARTCDYSVMDLSSARKPNLKTEAIAGITTFFTMAYIVIVNPQILSADGKTGMAFTGVLTATVLICFTMTLLMGVYAKLPFAVAPGMGINAFLTYTIILGKGVPWPTALGITFWAGVFFLLISV
jgi:threonine aldolase